LNGRSPSAPTCVAGQRHPDLSWINATLILPCFAFVIKRVILQGQHVPYAGIDDLPPSV
jgi:hypothetical protein